MLCTRLSVFIFRQIVIQITDGLSTCNPRLLFIVFLLVILKWIVVCLFREFKWLSFAFFYTHAEKSFSCLRNAVICGIYHFMPDFISKFCRLLFKQIKRRLMRLIHKAKNIFKQKHLRLNLF